MIRDKIPSEHQITLSAEELKNIIVDAVKREGLEIAGGSFNINIGKHDSGEPKFNNISFRVKDPETNIRGSNGGVPKDKEKDGWFNKNVKKPFINF